jgi:hypothetical protein
MIVAAQALRPVHGPAKRHPWPIIVLVFCLLAQAPVPAQELTAKFYPQKSVYLLGEPVWFVFEITNKGNVPIHIEYSNPYGVCALGGGYSFDIPTARAVGRWRCGYVASCAGGGSEPLPAGATYRSGGKFITEIPVDTRR